MSISKGSERVKAWIYAVINPWSEALEVENQLLASGNTTFRWLSKKLEYIRPVAEHLGSRSARLILDDLTRGAPGVREFALSHDNCVHELEVRANEAHHFFVSSAEFGDEFRSVIEHLEKRNTSVVPTMSRDDLIAWVAQRIINNGADASDRWEDFSFWKTHQATLLSYRARLGKLTSDIDTFHRMNEEQIRHLDDLRTQLVENYDVPPAFVA
jgi:hypothetical protein